ncbi:type II secretion system protein M [Caldimonas thermodepolymerans]|jgi:Type II secretory pathway, component PulM|uniref:General secretion pathway protein GspM n=1 Tax=Caldimonas thermodepolymerans TaxID=215580 RepID=A0A2S5T685_9BURK|nr:type II secretion system protein GspM [Caldimonas thermodepolymerans]PPE70452.1 general secretion pathway protein GspM [Caldimonas thermodepolymerans]QPC31119.1 type II secretion system protein M [Caldimonas thermodepolymerans]RDH96573.1 general secretion pathway protein M [Caldimonas thermodepolymerans]TCP04828.1 general secretion pathway protein M [Caldimonas thermodepolymerans]UZG43846.1 type II secretion system protein M [Caldimonas thermodepolymerans]
MKLDQVKAQAAARWAALGARERRLVLAAGLLLVVALVWWVGLQPALRTLREAPPRIAQLDEELRVMRGLAAESQQLKSAPTINQGQAVRALQAATERLGPAGRLNVQADQATLTLQSAPAEAVLGWLGEARSAGRARVVQAQLVRSGDGYNGTVVLALPGGGS